jgi:chromosome segregation ATPase
VTGGENGEEKQSIAGVAAELAAEVAEFESLTRRVSKVELATHKDLAKTGELLAQAEGSHKRFIERLRALIVAIDDVRARQNASAAALSACSDRLDAQKKIYEELEQRFVELGEAAREVNELVQAGAEAGRETDAGPDRDAALEKLALASERLKGSIDAASALMQDARSAGLSDLERQADSMRQQLQSLAKKLERAGAAL